MIIMPKISIIVPVYKSEKLLVRCINSILSQNFSDFELILVNDGSPDDCPKICDDFAKYDKRVVVIHKKNGGVSSARNKGIELAKGEFITFIDSDDYILPNMLSDFMSVVNHNEDIDLLLSGLTMKIYNNDTLIKTIPYEMMSKHYNTKTLLEGLDVEYKLINISGPTSKLYRKNILTTNKIYFDEEMDLGEDTYFNLCYLEHCKKIVSVNGIYYHYMRQNKDSLFSKYHKDTLEIQEKVFGKMRDLIIKNNCHTKCRYNFEKMYYNILISTLSKEFQNPEKNDIKSLKRIIKQIIHDKNINKFIKSFKLSGTKHNVIKTMVILGNVNLLYLTLRMYYRNYFKN